MRARKVFEKKDPEAFALSLERLFEVGLRAHGVRPYLIRHRLAYPGYVHIEIVLHSAFDLPHVENFIEEEFIQLTETSAATGPSSFRDLSPIESTLRLGPIRQNLPEWRDFALDSFLVTVNTLFGEAFRAALSYLSGSESKEGLHPTGETLQELFGLAQQLDRSFSQLFASFKKTEQELLLPETSGPLCPPEPGPLESPFPSATEAGISPAEVAAFLSSQAKMLERLALIAEENGIPVQAPLPASGDDHSILQAEGFRRLVSELDKLKLTTLKNVEDFFLRKLADWEDLYSRFELARLKGLLPKEQVSSLELLALLVQSCRDI